MSEKKSKRGGSRTGAGRHKGSHKTKVLSYRVREDWHDELKQIIKTVVDTKKKSALSLFLIFTLLISSCKKTCEPWYNGQQCKTEIRAQYYGTYNGVNSVSGTSTITVSAHSNGPQYLSFGAIYARLDNETSGSYTIPAQEVNYYGQFYTITGNGYFSGNSMSQTVYINGAGMSYFAGYR